MRAHIRSYTMGKRRKVEVDIFNPSHPDGLTRNIGGDLNARELAALKIGMQSAFLLAGYAVSDKHHVLTEERR